MVIYKYIMIVSPSMCPDVQKNQGQACMIGNSQKAWLLNQI